MKRIKLISLLVFTLFFGSVYANNVRLSNLVVSTVGGVTSASFDIAWDNSWFFNTAPNNWDAVWVFFKSYDCQPINKSWDHVDVSVTSGDHSTSAPLQVDAVTDGKGVFIRRSTPGTFGNVPTTSVTVEFQNMYDVSHINFKVIGIEMVAVLQGDFQTGGVTGVETSTSDLTAHHAFSVHDITSEAAIPAGTLRTDGTGTTTSWNQWHPNIHADFPKGYNQFYIMKYAISQEQYASFLNMLTYAQQNTRTNSTPTSVINTNALATSSTTLYQRNGVKIMVPSPGSPTPAEYGCNVNNDATFNDIDDGQNLACNFLSWSDLQAYLDWSALRPMTELEYEKACRGFSPTVADEYAWGNDVISNATAQFLVNPGEGSEYAATSLSLPSGTGIAAVGASNTSYGPLRVGFPAMATTDRIAAGASYWGVMELSGNVYEQTMSVGRSNGSISTTFVGTLGDGELSTTGHSDVPGWNNISYSMSIVRGGSWYDPATHARVGSRYQLGNSTNSSRSYQVGGRGVRQF